MRASLVTVACLTLAGCAANPRSGGPRIAPSGPVKVLIVVADKPDLEGRRECGYYVPSVVRARSHDDVDFEIVNLCSVDVDVEIKFTNGDPFTDRPPYELKGLAKAGGRDAIAFKVKEHQRRKPYDYHIKINGKAGKDPRFEVDP